jgi:GNAT superfamily N-acetyltransferase
MSTPSPIVLRALQADDLPALLRIQLACYGHEFVESADVYARRLSSAVNCSLVGERAGAMCAYLAAYRSEIGKVTPLHGDFASPRDSPDTLYLHDMAVLPSHAGQGLARALLEALWDKGRAWGLRRSALVSVQDSRRYWERHGYIAQPLHDIDQRLQLATYGDGAVYMVREL